LSGIEAVRRIVETEAEAKRIIEEAKSKAQEILEGAAVEAQNTRQAAISRAEQQKAQMLKETRERAEADARSSDMETNSLLENYKKLFEDRRDVAVRKAVELILGG
jgi:V/A-type H+-transporting ATPase subunit G/H